VNEQTKSGKGKAVNEQTSGVFYGWWVVVAAFVSVFIAVGVGIFTFGVFFKGVYK